jgi:hypothetical protein
MRIPCRGNPFTEQLPSDSLGIVDVFTGRYQATAAVQKVTVKQRVYAPQYLLVPWHIIKHRDNFTFLPLAPFNGITSLKSSCYCMYQPL